ncbi:MAG: ABC transporter [Desulfuromonas sp.]|nr:MAG: ABC transporter [Desulfuromonas sp.]
MLPPLLEAQQVTLQRGDGTSGMKPVLRDISLSLDAGELVAVVGPSGSGKSTLLRLFNRLLEADSGTVLFQGQDIRTLSPPELRSKVVLVAQKPQLFSGTVRENLAIPAKLRRESSPRSTEDDQRLLELCRLESSFLDRDSQRLSIGQQQRVCLARAMSGPCQALLLDEPTSALDWPTAEALTHTFRDLADQKGLGVLLVTHDLRVARLCADRLVVLINGEVAASGRVKDVLADPGSQGARDFLFHPEPQRTGEGT